MAIEIAVGVNGWGEDLVLTATGDIALLQDTPGNPAASRQKLARIVLTSPLLRDAYGNPVGKPDNIYYPNTGSGVRALVGQPYTGAVADDIANRIIAAIALVPTFATNPAPTVTSYLAADGSDLLYVSVVAYAVTGEQVTLPPTALQAFTS